MGNADQCVDPDAITARCQRVRRATSMRSGYGQRQRHNLANSGGPYLRPRANDKEATAGKLGVVVLHPEELRGLAR